MLEQVEFYAEQTVTHEANIKKARWQAGFQKWSDAKSQDERTEQGKCGWGVICDYCSDCSYGKPCVRALNAMLRDKGGHIDYERADYGDIWGGVWSED